MKISFVIPFYNSHAHLPECLSSIFQHSSGDIEVIIVDDSSPDQSFRENLQQWDIRLFRTDENQGPSAARNLGLKKASGDYVAFVDSDDFLVADPFKLLATGLDMSESHDTPELIVGRLFEPEKTPENDEPFWNTRITNIRSEPVVVRLGNFSTLLYKRSWLADNEIAFQEGMSFGEDGLFLLRCLSRASSVAMVGYAFYNYRRHNKSLVASPLTPARLQDRVTLLNQAAHALKDAPDAAIIRKLSIFKWNLRQAKRARDELGEDVMLEYLSALSPVCRQHLKVHELLSAREQGLVNVSQRQIRQLKAIRAGNLENFIF